MAINLCCPACYKTYKLGTLICKCGNNLRTNKLFKVRIKHPDGKWKSKQVNTLELARKVEAKFKTQAVEQTIFDIHNAPIPNTTDNFNAIAGETSDLAFSKRLINPGLTCNLLANSFDPILKGSKYTLLINAPGCIGLCCWIFILISPNDNPHN